MKSSFVLGENKSDLTTDPLSAILTVKTLKLLETRNWLGGIENDIKTTSNIHKRPTCLQP